MKKQFLAYMSKEKLNLQVFEASLAIAFDQAPVIKKLAYLCYDIKL